MVVLEVDGAKISVSVDVDMTEFIGEGGKESSRLTTKVTIWQHMDTGRKYQQLVPIAEGYSFCQANDPYDMELGVRQATTRALDGLGYTSNINHVVKKVHQLTKAYARENAQF